MEIESQRNRYFLAMMRTKFPILSAISFFCLISFCFNNSFADELGDEIRYLDEFATSIHLIKTKYIRKKESKELVRSSILGLVNALDPYSAVLSADDLKDLELQAVGQYVGIGVSISFRNGRYFITQVYNDSPASKAGVKKGDEILKINGIPLPKEKKESILDSLDGKLGEMLELELKNPNNIKKVNLARELVKANSVECFEENEAVLVIAIHQFLKHTAKESKKCLDSSQNKPVILDLRNNPGGLLVSAVEVADLFLDIGDIVHTRDRDNRIIERYIARKPLERQPQKLVVLINGFSASAAEILAGALKDRKRGVLVGETSFGKGVVQSIYPISNDLFLKITTALYFTPSEVGIDGKGIMPDFYINDLIKSDYYNKEDQIFAKALDLVGSESKAK